MIPALMKKFSEAAKSGSKTVEVWGTDSTSREFLYVDDAAGGIVMAAKRYDKPDPVNLESGKEISIKDQVEMIVRLTGFDGEIKWVLRSLTDSPAGAWI